jgi:tRNA G18 (ribose-2'-O)-methylase SpoU
MIKNTDTLNIINDLQGLSYNTILNISKSKRIPCSVLTLGVKGNRNIGNMCRTAEIFGLSNFITIGSTNLDMRSAVGSHNYLNLDKIKCTLTDPNDVENCFNQIIQKYNMIPIFVEQGGIDFFDVDWTQYKNQHICYVLGSEDSGIPQNILDMKKKYKKSLIISIKQQGIGRSLNVCNACAIIINNDSLIRDNLIINKQILFLNYIIYLIFIFFIFFTN